MIPQLLFESLVSVAIFCILSRYSHTGSGEQVDIPIGAFFVSKLRRRLTRETVKNYKIGLDTYTMSLP